MKTVLSPLSRSIALIALTWYPCAATAQNKPAAPGDTQGYAYAAPAFIKELDTRYPAQPPVPPSPPRYGGVLHFPATVRAFDPTAGYRPELALVWDTLTEWEATWYFPEVQRTPTIRKTLATSWEMVNPSWRAPARSSASSGRSWPSTAPGSPGSCTATSAAR